MYFGSIESGLKFGIFLLLIALIFSIFIGKRKKNLFLGIFSFSLLSNFIFYLDSSSLFYDVYDLKWIVKFTLNYWPWINLVLFVLVVIDFFKNRQTEKK